MVGSLLHLYLSLRNRYSLRIILSFLFSLISPLVINAKSAKLLLYVNELSIKNILSPMLNVLLGNRQLNKSLVRLTIFPPANSSYEAAQNVSYHLYLLNVSCTGLTSTLTTRWFTYHSHVEISGNVLTHLKMN